MGSIGKRYTFPMTKTAPYFLIGLGVIVMGAIAWWFGFREKTPEPEPVIPNIPQLSEGLSIYASGEHGFSIAYPSGARLEEGYEGPWRSNALPEVSSTNILSITTYSVENGSSYPRYYYTVVRIGFSEEPKEVAECLSPRNGEKALSDVVLGDDTFKVFSFGDAAMMQYMRGESYRALYEGKCFAIETIARGSSYREETTATDIPEETLTAEYQKLGDIVMSFRFAR